MIAAIQYQPQALLTNQGISCCYDEIAWNLDQNISSTADFWEVLTLSHFSNLISVRI